MKKTLFPISVFLVIPMVTFLMSSCKNENNSKKTVTNDTVRIQTIAKADFSADTAYNYVNEQVVFGPRVPGSKAQSECATWMEQNLKRFCDTVYKQTTTVTGGDGKKMPCINLIGVINPKATKRILFLTHWDSRPWADMDVIDKTTPILAADDGASGVGVLLEVARQLKMNNLSSNLGIDILFTDVEDYGRSEWGDDSYCLGTQYWAHHPHIVGYKADFGVLLDMVGGVNAQFPMEALSAKYAAGVQQNIYQEAIKAGYSSYFPATPGPEIIDDHVPVNKITGIPTVDIINLDVNSNKVFAPHWHTHQDNMQVIDRNTLKAVGQTLLQVIYDTANPS